MRSRIIGSGFVTGENMVTNDQLGRMMDTSDSWIRERSGIEPRYYVERGTTTSDLGVGAAKQGDRGRRHFQGRDRLHRLRHHDAGPLLPRLRRPPPGQARDRPRSGARHPPAVHRVHLRPPGLRRADQGRAGAHGAPGRRRSPLRLHALDQAGTTSTAAAASAPTEEERAVATRFRDRTVLFGDAAGAVVLRASEGRRAGCSDSSCTPTAANSEDLYVPGVGFAHRPFVDRGADPRVAPRPGDGRARGVQAGGVAHAGGGARLCAKQRHDRRTTSTCSSPTRPTCGSTRRCRRRWGCRTSASTTTSSGTGTPPPRPSPSPYDECRKSGRIREARLVCFVGLGSGFHWGAALMRA